MDGLSFRNYSQTISGNSGNLGTSATREGGLLENRKLPSSNEATQSFADVLKDSIQAVDQLQKKSDHLMQELATGKTGNVSEVMIAAEQADIALKLMVQVRNKMIDAYQEIMKMQV